MSNNNNNMVDVHLNPIKNALSELQRAINANELKGVLVVGKYRDNGNYLICRTPMDITEEIDLAAQLSANVQANYVEKIFTQQFQ